jgi:hypothetical protein
LANGFGHGRFFRPLTKLELTAVLLVGGSGSGEPAA